MPHTVTHTHAYSLSLSLSAQVELEHSYPLSNVEKLHYDDATYFQLFFPSFTIVLRAGTVEEAKDWVERMVKGEYDSYAFRVSPYKPPSTGFDNYNYKHIHGNNW